jgi:predicted LPLAT superfamily acyltransferase
LAIAIAYRQTLEGAVKARHWAQIDEVTFVAGIRFLFVVFRVLGRWPFRVLLYPVVAFYVARYPSARAASRAYLARVWRSRGFPERDVDLRLILRHFVAFSECILDRLRVWSGSIAIDDVEFHGRDVVAARIASGRGGLFISAHLGNIDLCRALSKHRPGLKLTALVHTKHATAFNRLLADVNQESDLNLVQVTEITPETAALLRERVDRGEYVVIAGDRTPVTPQARATTAEFLGAPAAFPVGPYVLAALLQCPTYLIFCLDIEGRYHVFYELFRDEIRMPRGDRDALLAQLAGAYAERLAHFCRLAPLQWFNFFDFWATRSNGAIDAAA